MNKCIRNFILYTGIGAIGCIHAQTVCEEPTSVPQDVWRTGLAAPIGIRTGLPTTHIVIHHSSDPNLDLQDYTPLVRNIYDTHTKANGWDDVGYNYLIAPNGVIYKGRDPQGVTSQDLVEGAHMCNKNENTMGICMIGNFTNVLPTKAALKALYLLGAWKINKDNLDPYGATQHAIGPTSAGLPAAMLPNICGHKDGCQANYTECPGALFHTTFQEVRDSIHYYSSRCNISAYDHEELQEFKMITIGNHAYMIPAVQYETLSIYNMYGTLLLSTELDSETIHAATLPKNEMLVVVLENSNNEAYKFKIIEY